MAQPWLSVIMPTFNGEAYLAPALDSIILQEDSDIECIVVDAQSTDATLGILHRYEQRLPLKILQREERTSWMVSTNFALSVASGEYVCFLHQDDLWFEDRLSTIRRLIEQFPEAVLFLHPSNYIDNAGHTLGRWSCPLPASPRVTGPELMTERLLVQNFISMPGPVFKRDVGLRVGGLDETMWYTADWDFWLKLAACGDVLYHPQPLSAFRIHSNSQTVLGSSDLAGFHQQLETVLSRHLATWNAPEPLRRKIARAARFSNEVNTTLAGMMKGNNSHFSKLLIPFLSLGPSGQYRYLRDSRIVERTSARLRARLLTDSRG